LGRYFWINASIVIGVRVLDRAVGLDHGPTCAESGERAGHLMARSACSRRKKQIAFNVMALLQERV
jgi:hypothetical protein